MFETAEKYVPLPADRAPEPAECEACGNNVYCEPHPFVYSCLGWKCADCGQEIPLDDRPV